MQFKIDENLPEELVEILLAAGYDASSVYRQNLAGQPDSIVSQICKSEKRVIVTLDVGFCDIRTYPPEEYCGIVVLRLKRQDKFSIMAFFGSLIPLFATEKIEGKLWIVDEQKVRIR